MNEFDDIKKRVAVLEEEIVSQRQMFVMTQEYLKKLKSDLEISKNQLEKANKYLTDSINYSTRIQKAIFQTESYSKKIFPESFIFFRPKDLLSGDLYWFFEKNSKKYAAVVDCTGHGVAGALLVMLVVSLLKQSISEPELDSPSKIISFIGAQFYKYTYSEAEKTQTGLFDSFDMGLLEVDLSARELRYSGVNRPLVLINDGKSEVIVGSKIPVGFYKEVDLNLQQVSVCYGPASTAYLFSDGIQDQFGGKDSTKLGLKRLVEELERINPFPSNEKKSSFENFFSQWMNNEKQIDDVLLIGIHLI